LTVSLAITFTPVAGEPTSWTQELTLTLPPRKAACRSGRGIRCGRPR
jgi:hypothetical protein